MNKRRAGLLILSMVLAACSTGSTPAGGSSRGLPEAATTPARYQPSAPRRAGGVIKVGTDLLPTRLSPYLGAQAAAVPIDQALYDGLVATDPALQWYGDLARQAPTVENGGVQRVGGGMDVTYELRAGLRWSDGQPLTPDDVIYTFQVLTGPGAAAGLSQEGYDRVSGIERRGENGLVVHFGSLYPAYLNLFPAVLPRHRLEAVPAGTLASDPYWTKPDVVSGPFVVEDMSADHVTVRRNPRYSDGRSGMPFLGHAAYAERVIFGGLPSRQAVLAALKAGDVQVGLDQTERELATIAGLSGVRVLLAPAMAYEQVSLNQAAPNPATGRVPPWAGDPAVAEALDLALDRPGLERDTLRGRAPLTATPVSPLVKWAFDGGLARPAYDLDRARRLLDGDGWAAGPDGIRVKDGRPLTLALTTVAGQQLRAAEEDTVADGWRKLGVDVRIQDLTADQLFASFDQGGALAQGRYEAALWSWITPPDPDSEFAILTSSQTPATGRRAAQNYSRCQDAAIDQALADGRDALDQATRGAAYRAFQRAYVRARCELPLYRRLDIGVVSPGLRNFVLNPGPGGNTWNIADWWL